LAALLLVCFNVPLGDRPFNVQDAMSDLLCHAVLCAGNAKLADIRDRCEKFASSFPMPGFEVADLH
jgi:hypothetical protein